MHNRIKVRFAQAVLAGMLALNSFWLPAPSHAQSSEDTSPPSQALKVHLPLIAGGAVVPPNNPERHLGYRVGSTYTYQWEMTVTSESISNDSQGTQAGSNATQLSGLVDLQVLAQDANGAYQLALAVRNPAMIASQHDAAATTVNDPAVTAALATPLLFTQAATGEVIEIRSPQDAPAAVVEIQKGIVNLLQVTLRDEEQYTVVEEGGQGRYHSHYNISDTADGLLVAKTIDEGDFIELVSAGTPEAQIKLNNRVEMRFDSSHGAPQAVHVVETITTGAAPTLADAADEALSAAAVEISVTAEGRLRLQQVNTTANETVVAATANYVQGSLRADLSDVGAPETAIDLSTVEIGDELVALEENPTNAPQLQRLADLIRQDESGQMLNAVADRVQQFHAGEQLNGYIDLLSMAATPEAQQILLDHVLNDAQVDSALKARALTQLADVKTPSTQLIERVNAMSQNGDPELRNLALLTLGGLAHTLQTTDPQAADSIATALSTHLQEATSDEARELYLLAIGNAGGAATESAVTPYLSSHNPHLRGAATLALRKVPANTVDRQLIDRLTHESSVYVQEMAAIALAQRLDTPALHTAEAEGALQAYAASVTAAAVDGVWAKNWNKSFSAGPVKINLPGDVTVKGAPDAPALTLDANQAANGSVMGINFSLFRAKLLSDAPSGTRRFGAYFWIGSNTLVWKYEENVGCSFAKSGVLWEGSREFFSFSRSIPVYGLLVVTLEAEASGYAKITYDYQQQLCNSDAATLTGKITPQAAITAQGGGYATLLVLRGGVTLTAEILKTTIPAQTNATLTRNGSSLVLDACIDVKAAVDPLTGKLAAKVEGYVPILGWKKIKAWNIWEFAVSSQNYTLLANCAPSGQDSFQIVAAHSNKCLDVTGGTGATANGISVQQWDCLGTSQTNQIWRMIPVGNAFQLVAAHSGKCLDVTGGTTATSNGARVQQWQCLGASQTNQLWRVAHVGSKVQLIAVHSGKCLDVIGGLGATANGTKLQQWDCLGAGQTNQLWELRRP